MEPELKKNEVQISSQHRISFEAKQVVLLTRNVKKSGDIEYIKSGHYGNLTALGDRLGDREFLEGLSEEDRESTYDVKQIIELSLIELDKLKGEIRDILSNGITISLGKDDE